MAITPSTDLYLLKVPIEIDNVNQLTFANETAQYNYFSGLQRVGDTDFTYQRKDSVIRYPANIDDIINFNYVMYRNENYSNKWFYAFITDMKYINDGMTEITIKTDPFQTWQFDLTFKNSFIEREHVNDDTIGAHTVPENLELGEYSIKSVNYIPLSEDDDDWYTCFVATKLPYEGAPWSGDWDSVGSAFSPLYIFAVKCENNNYTDARKILEMYNRTQDVTSDAIINVYPIPADFIPTGQGSGETWTVPAQVSKPAITVGVYHVQGSYGSTSGTTIAQDSTLAGNYSPKNKKLFTYPFSYFHISNNCGEDIEYRWEDFPLVNGVPTATYRKIMIPTASLSARIVFDEYKGYCGREYGDKLYAYGMQFAKVPICAWTTDYYTNWLTQNGLNVATSVATGALSGAANLATGNVITGATSVLGSIANAIVQNEQAKRVPDQYHGDVNSADTMFAYFRNNMNIYKMTVRPEMARIIDGYLSMYGYKVNTTKLPNITGRRNWNYVKTLGCNIEAYIPQEDLQEIKDMFDNGVTLWHNSATFLDYSQDNSII